MSLPWFARVKGHMRSVVPSRCAVCGSWPSARLCEDCVARFAGPEPRCTTCARVLPGPARQCGECILAPPPLDQCLAAVHYAYPWSDCITRFKFDEDPAWVGPLAALLRSAPWVEPALDTADLVLPMPLHPARLQARGFNQAQLLAQAKLGAHLSAQEADVFAYLTRKGQIDLTDVKALTGLSGADARQLAQRLTVQALLVAQGGSDNVFVLAEHLRARFLPVAPEQAANSEENQRFGSETAATDATAQATDQATAQAASGRAQLVQSLVQLSAIQWHIVAFADAPRSITELMGRTGHKQRAFFKRQHLEPLLAGGILKMTVPDKPTSPAQRYVLTEAGVKLKQLHEQQQAAGQPENEDHGH